MNIEAIGLVGSAGHGIGQAELAAIKEPGIQIIPADEARQHLTFPIELKPIPDLVAPYVVEEFHSPVYKPSRSQKIKTKKRRK